MAVRGDQVDELVPQPSPPPGMVVIVRGGVATTVGMAVVVALVGGLPAIRGGTRAVTVAMAVVGGVRVGGGMAVGGCLVVTVVGAVRVVMAVRVGVVACHTTYRGTPTRLRLQRSYTR